MGQLAILGRSGDTKVIWSPDNADEVAAARNQFDALTQKGFAAFAVRRDGEKGQRVTEFDPDAAKLILVPAMRGGA